MDPNMDGWMRRTARHLPCLVVGSLSEQVRQLHPCGWTRKEIAHQLGLQHYNKTDKAAAERPTYTGTTRGRASVRLALRTSHRLSVSIRMSVCMYVCTINRCQVCYVNTVGTAAVGPSVTQSVRQCSDCTAVRQPIFLRHRTISCCLKYLLSSSSTSTRLRKYLTENLFCTFL